MYIDKADLITALSYYCNIYIYIAKLTLNILADL